MRDTLQSKLIAAFTLLAAVAVVTGSVLVFGYAVAALAFATIIAVVLRPIARHVWTTWDARRIVHASKDAAMDTEVPDTRRAA